MQTNLTWKKGLFSTTYSIYSNGRQIGKLNEKSFSQTAYGELNNRKYIFKTKGLLKQHTQIIDGLENKVIGEITYSNWMTKASILVNGKTINWKYDNIWNTKWSIYDSEGINIKSSCSMASGQIESNVDDALLLLSGLYVTNYYKQMTIAVLIAVFVPLWTTIALH